MASASDTSLLRSSASRVVTILSSMASTSASLSQVRSVLLPQELLDKLDARVTAGGGNRSEVVRAALRAYLEE